MLKFLFKILLLNLLKIIIELLEEKYPVKIINFQEISMFIKHKVGEGQYNKIFLRIVDQISIACSHSPLL